MKFLKSNFHEILKLYINQIGIVIFSLALLFPLEAMGGEEGIQPVWSILASVASVIFYYVLIYYVVWDLGARDKIRIDSGRYEPTPARGALLGLYANIPNLILALPLLVFTVINVLSGACAQVAAIFNLLTRFHSAMYLGTVLGITGFNSDPSSSVQIVVAALFVFLPLLSVAITHLAYYLGSREKRILWFLAPKSN